jgi:hypothetical protein
MSTLLENVQKVRQANEDIRNAISAHGISVSESSKLSDAPGLIRKIPRPASWGRPADWPRIDLINMYGLDHDVCYFIIRKPEDTINHGFCLLCNTSDKSKWCMEHIDVAEDGSGINAISSLSAESGSTIDFEFPENDSTGSIYAVRVCSATGGESYLTLKRAKPERSSVSDGEIFNSGSIEEAIIRTKDSQALSFSQSGGYFIAGPRHVAYYACKKGIQQYAVRNCPNLEFLEVRDGSLFQIRSAMPSFIGQSQAVVEFDDDVKITVVAPMIGYSSTPFRPDQKGEINYLG